METVKIVIATRVGEGKSTLAVQITDYLKSIGYSVENTDEDYISVPEIVSDSERIISANKSLQAKINIQVSTKSVARSIK